MLKVAICAISLALAGLLYFLGRELPDRFGREFEYADGETAPRKILISEKKDLQLGLRIYYPHVRHRSFGKVAGVERNHEFPSGLIADAVLIEFKEGTQVWVRRDHLDKFQIETTGR